MDRRHFFVSRSGADTRSAAWLCHVLSQHGYSYHEQGQWPPGTNFVTAMGEAIEQSDYTLALFSERYFAPNSHFTKQEWTSAQIRGKLIGIRLDMCMIPTILLPFTYIDLTIGHPAQQAEVVVITALRQLVTTPPVAPWAPPPTTTRVFAREARSLPYLCDREIEETRLQSKMRDRDGKAIVFVIHGDEQELPEKFATRIKHVSVYGILSVSEPNIRSVFVTWPAAQTAKDFLMKLKAAVRTHELEGFAPEDAMVVSTDVDAEGQQDRDLPAQVKQFIDFWSGFAVGQACVVVVCLAIRYPSARIFDLRRHWATRRMKRTIAELRLTQPSNCWITPEPLDSVPRQQARNWTTLPHVQAVMDIDKSHVDTIYESRKKMPMRELVPKLDELLAGMTTQG